MTPKQQFDFKAPSHKATTGAVPAIVSPSPLFGVWTNTDTATNDIVKIIIEAAGAGISVQVFGACVPTPCVWGAVPGIAYAASVSSSPAVGFTAFYKFSFAQVIVTGHHEGRFLNLKTFTEFTDGSGRSNLYTADQMVK
ncbi:MAG: hypothetical protein ABSH09_09495 [Bryobacteraceae bacterium]|jgi:hypothetical protein